MCLNEEGPPHLFDRRQVVASHVDRVLLSLVSFLLGNL